MITNGLDQMQELHLNLLRNPEVMEYVRSRGVSLDAISKFKIGYFDRVKASRYYQRVMFPVRDMHGNVHTFQGRWIEEQYDVDGKLLPKFWHASYEKSKVLYGLYENKRTLLQKNRAVLVEGPMDVTATWQSSEAAVSAFGTAFTFAQACLLRRFVDEVVIWYDPDKAGQKAAVKTFEILEQAQMRRAYFVQSELDPAALYAEHGANAVREVIRDAK